MWNGFYFEDEDGNVVDNDLTLDDIFALVDEDEFR